MRIVTPKEFEDIYNGLDEPKVFTSRHFFESSIPVGFDNDKAIRAINGQIISALAYHNIALSNTVGCFASGMGQFDTLGSILPFLDWYAMEAS